MTDQSGYQKDKDKYYPIWKQLMELGATTGCHQMPERSFYLNGYQFPVCARCTGVFIGNLLAVLLFIKKGFLKRLSILGCFLMLADWSIQKLKIKESNNHRRILTGIAGGFGIMMIQLASLKWINGKIRKG